MGDVVASRDLALRLIVGALGAGHCERLEAAQARALMTVSATVVDPAKAATIRQVQSVLITAQDLERGFVDVPLGSRLELKPAHRCVIELSASGPFFRSLSVRSAHGANGLVANGATVRQRICDGTAATVDLSYRFELDPAVRPGLYRWPVSIAVAPL